ncbi:hypothetical protein B0T22DRAFT_286878 [Podospora appendiculata]|uniref:Uncharacterized protein n=1 Tax=Podospora appendiculata TaxID=314037 RepID=A0AAE0X0X3_9PEZI|nr:hypothetical protein B0T22DRAFT_286878 [Podospora appendiculata]
MPEVEQTDNEDFEYISYYTFGPVNYERSMSWQAGGARILIGKKPSDGQGYSGRPNSTQNRKQLRE